ncbi:hypothetical protein K493DRAFT_357560 [Basidiobolus meristosporus CBS 931.73]|uniref:Uncharacterized protein n=1 Tax=Basidiobolus meristosporus CBS 931.73 TaxID=1314790 RepID=A0A1Y1XVU7_9FUNG|nr:hypothetical protein K493DRAFT_357560 [Basidiobolus meristosporus CBS 931.73]|eukprot:ORX89892.1 hypothetical protein K493DRAFT_357560 [Basidiobolus meristosporus CBS 931.73]
MSDQKAAEKKHEEYLEEIKAARAKEEQPPPSYDVPDANGMTEAAKKKHQEYDEEAGPSHAEESLEDLPPPDYAHPEPN